MDGLKAIFEKEDKVLSKAEIAAKEKKHRAEIRKQNKKAEKNLVKLLSLLKDYNAGKKVNMFDLYQATSEARRDTNNLFEELKIAQENCEHKRFKDTAGFIYDMRLCLDCGYDSLV